MLFTVSIERPFLLNKPVCGHRLLREGKLPSLLVKADASLSISHSFCSNLLFALDKCPFSVVHVPIMYQPPVLIPSHGCRRSSCECASSLCRKRSCCAAHGWILASTWRRRRGSWFSVRPRFSGSLACASNKTGGVTQHEFCVTVGWAWKCCLHVCTYGGRK